MKPRIAIIDGIRTPFCKAGGTLKSVAADDLGAFIVRELLARTKVPAARVDQVIFGNVAQPMHAANVARVIALKAGLPKDVTALTVHRNCASGMQSITSAASEILSGRAEIIIAGGTESMSQIPLIFNAKMTQLFVRLAVAKTMRQRARALVSIRPSFLRPVIALKLGLSDPVCGLNMGETTERLARRFGVTRTEQDEFSFHSHRKAVDARQTGRFAEEIAPFIVPPEYDEVVLEDDGPRPNQTREALAKLRPYFVRHSGTVTVGNTCSVTDGAVAVLVASERAVRELGLEPLGYLSDWAYAALEGEHMGLGPTYATAKLFQRGSYQLSEFDLIELNEAFAAQVIANERTFASKQFARAELGQSKSLGTIDRDRLNVNGGAVALGHPVGATGARLVLTILKELRRRNRERGLATLCVGGGQGAALVLEAA